MTAFDVAERLAPPPTKRLDELGVGGEREAEWTRHYAALALAAHAEFREALKTVHGRGEPGSRPELGYFMAIATSATAAVVALGRPDRVGEELWDLTPECGALNGEYLDYLADLLDKYGVNPADIYPWYEAADFESTSRVAGSQETTGPLIQPSVQRDPSKDVVALDVPEAVAESDARRGTTGAGQ